MCARVYVSFYFLLLLRNALPTHYYYYFISFFFPVPFLLPDLYTHSFPLIPHSTRFSLSLSLSLSISFSILLSPFLPDVPSFHRHTHTRESLIIIDRLQSGYKHSSSSYLLTSREPCSEFFFFF